MWGASMKNSGKGPEECPTGCWWRLRGLALDKGEAVGRAGYTKIIITPFKGPRSVPSVLFS